MNFSSQGGEFGTVNQFLLVLNLIKVEVPQQVPQDNDGHLKRSSLCHRAQTPLKSRPISSRVSHVTSAEEMVDLVQYPALLGRLDHQPTSPQVWPWTLTTPTIQLPALPTQFSRQEYVVRAARGFGCFYLPYSFPRNCNLSFPAPSTRLATGV